MKRWETGQELLSTTYKGKPNEFFKAIENGEIIPCHTETIEDGCHRIFPQHCQRLRGKQARMEELELSINKSDDEILMDYFGPNHLEPGYLELHYPLANKEERERSKSEQGSALLKNRSRKKPAWEKELENLRAEFGDQLEKLSPSNVWRGITLNGTEKKWLLEASYLVGDGDQEESHSENQTQETDDDMVKRLKQAGKGEVEIARALKKANPQIFRHRLGKLITQKEGEQLSVSGWQKRADKILRQLK